MILALNAMRAALRCIALARARQAARAVAITTTTTTHIALLTPATTQRPADARRRRRSASVGGISADARLIAFIAPYSYCIFISFHYYPCSDCAYCPITNKLLLTNYLLAR